ncbi:hypothetical protein PEDI_03480 [Persicobacter diffluens]|uniref:Transcription regulator TrmB N-terminal domain-containing protein n=2 Tax=Persicobacter diffluens TaxID=981 RepID=A0AAN4VTP3_9BACT|nr:hypothetical protein PEDI_03480 [Persicobacter diffluens]
MDELLSKIGFSQQELKIYRLLLDKGELAVSEISRVCGIPTSKLYAFMEGLADKGYCRLTSEKPKMYAVNSPKSAFSRRRDELLQQEQELAALSKKLEEQFQKLDQPPVSVFRTLTDADEILKEYYRLFRLAEEIGVGFSKAPYSVDISNLPEVNPSEEASMEKGVVFKGIYEIPKGESEEDVKRLASYFKSQGEEVRMAKALPFKMLMVDFQYVLLLIHGGNDVPVNMALSIEDEAFARSMFQLFNFYWESAAEL